MKIIIFIAACCLVFFSCKKDTQNEKKLWVSKVYNNGLLWYEYIYGTNKKPLQRNEYTTNQGQSSFSGYRLYKYNADDLLNEMVRFGANNSVQSNTTLEYDINKRLARLNDTEDDAYYLFEYTSGNQLSKYTAYNGVTQKKSFEALFSYDAKGTPIKIIRNGIKNNNPVLYDSTTCTMEKILPAHWSYYETLPIISLPKGDRIFYDMVLNDVFIYRPDAPPQKDTITYKNRVFDAGGYLTSQVISTKTVYGSVTTKNSEMKYEYVEL